MLARSHSFARLSRSIPRIPRHRYDLGMELKAGGDTTGAIAAFQRAIELKPDFEKAHYDLGIALRAQGKTDAAQKELNELNGLHDFRARLAQSKLLILQGVDALKQQQARRCPVALSESAAEQSPSLPTSYYYLGRHVGAQGRRRARPGRLSRKLSSCNPTTHKSIRASGCSIGARTIATRAIEEFRQAVMSDPDLGRSPLQSRPCAGSIGPARTKPSTS